jgi:hypothetical protein
MRKPSLSEQGILGLSLGADNDLRVPGYGEDHVPQEEEQPPLKIIHQTIQLSRTTPVPAREFSSRLIAAPSTTSLAASHWLNQPNRRLWRMSDPEPVGSTTHLDDSGAGELAGEPKASQGENARIFNSPARGAARSWHPQRHLRVIVFVGPVL